MTTFTSDDREEAYKKIVEEAPNQPGYEDAVPIPFAGWVKSSPPHIVDSGASVMGISANELADKLMSSLTMEYDCDKYMEQAATMLRQQQAEIDRLNYDMEGFKQNFFVSGFHLQIKMANEQLLKQQEQIDALKSELDRAVELYTDKSIENEALKDELKRYADAIGEERGNKALKNHEIAAVLTQVLDDCGLLRKAQEK